jgi:hypothetical protein
LIFTRHFSALFPKGKLMNVQSITHDRKIRYLKTTLRV